MPLLPVIQTREEFDGSPRDEATYAPAIREICRRHGIPVSRAAKYAGGSTIVFAIDDAHVVKLFEPIFTAAAETEAAALAHVDGRLGIPTPRVIATGEMEGWRYVIMSQLRGRPLREAWNDIPPADRPRLVGEVGAALRRQHSLATDGLVLPGPAWPDFIARQRATCVEQQRRNGLAEAWLAQIPDFLAAVDLPPMPPVLLHTEIMREHVLVTREGTAEWVVSGLLDYEPAMVGAAEYDLPCIFLADGDPVLYGEFLRGYGLQGKDADGDFARRMMAYLLLHRYSNLRWYLDRFPPKRATTLAGLAAEWFGEG